MVNSLYGDTFVVPETKLPSVGARIMGLDDPTQKMSKSAAGPSHAVNLLDPPSRIKKLIGRAVTDSQPAVNWAEPGAGVKNLLTIFQAFSGWDDGRMESHFAGMGYGDLKKNVTEMVVSHLEPIQSKYEDLMAHRDHLRKILNDSAERIAPIAEQTVRLAKERTGLYTG